ncbi:hypothetical protein BN1723_001070, partial [Verticillium longisporum]
KSRTDAMGFQAVCRALYDYVPQADAELAITEGDLLYILDKSSDDGWWKAKKKASTGNGSAAQIQPLQPQQTGPAPPVRFGVTGEAKRLALQPTGRRANLSQATPNNPFGF